MAYNIELNSTQEFSSIADPQPEIQQWSFSPGSPIETFYIQGESIPSDIEIAFDIKDYISLFGDTYDEYYIKASVLSNTAPIISISGDVPDAAGDGYLLSPSNLSSTISVAFQNFSIYENITKVNQIFFYVFGKNTDQPLESIEFVSFSISVRFVDSESIFVWPTSLVFEHVKTEDLPDTQDVDIYAPGDFVLRTEGFIELTGGNLSYQGTISGFKVYNGSGDQTISVGLDGDINEETSGSFVARMGFVNSEELFGAGIGQSIYDVYISTYDNFDVTVSPTSLEFFAIKNVAEAEPQTVSVFGYGDISIEAPAWLTVTVNNDYNTGIVVVPISEVNFSPGTYEGVVVVTVDETEYEVTVVHNVYENVQLGMSLENLNFTDDFNTISEFHNTEEFDVNVDLTVDYTSYGNTTLDTATIPLKIGLFKNRASLFVGKSVRHVMRELLSLESVSMDFLGNLLPIDASGYIRNYYNPAIVNMTVGFEHSDDEGLNQTFSYENIKFVKGRKPSHAFPKSVVLDYYKEPLRVTPNSVALFNFYKEESHTLRIFRNEELVSSVFHNPGVNRLFAYKHDFSDYSPGDVVEIRLHKNLEGLIDPLWYNQTENYVSQKYIVFPRGKETYHIGWEDEYGVCSLMEFTGSLRFSMSFENNTVLNYDNFLETLRKIDSRFDQKVVCNTGYILKGNTKRIESLLKAKRAWIVSKANEKSIPLVPSTKKLSGNDVDRGLYEYDIEFTLNPDYDYKSYT